MFKKFLWLIIAVVFLCSPLWALEDNPWNNVLNDYLFASADQPQASTPAQTKLPQLKLQPLNCGGPLRESASPTDFCFSTNNCFNQVVFCLQGGFLQPGTQVLSFQDPGNVCPPNPACPIYPFEVRSVHIGLTECDPAGTGAVAMVQPVIYSADLTNPLCPKPGNVICAGPAQLVNVLPILCQEFVLPLDPNCCVTGPYFAGVRIITPGTVNLSLCLDSTCTPCCNYADFGGGFLEWCAIAPVPIGDFAIWTDGIYCCQSLVCGPCPAPADTLRNHFKTWRIFTNPFVDTFALVRDQFTIHDFLFVDSIDFLSNPVRKIVFGPVNNDTSDILRPDDHLTWYRVKSSNNRRINVQVTYVNQFESTKVFIDTVKYFLLPTHKLFPGPHNPPDTLLGHYTAYRIHKPKGFRRPVQLDDQFDQFFGQPELIDSLVPVYFLTPADKNNELRPESDTHYVAYQIFPQTFLPPFSAGTFDQWGQQQLQVRNSEYLLVPSRKDTFVVCTHKPNDCNGDGVINLADIICDVNVVFKGFPSPTPKCRCDSNCDNVCNLIDIVYKKNYVFGGGPPPVPRKECCRPVP